jgi:hypothetical protein
LRKSTIENLGEIANRLNRKIRANDRFLRPVLQSLRVYDQDGLISRHNHDFTLDPSFVSAYLTGLRFVPADEKQKYSIPWRLHVCLWAASHAAKLSGSFVECGVNHGFYSSAIMQYLDWNNQDRQYYLFDTWCGLDESLISDEELELGRLKATESYSECYRQVKRNFEEFENVTLIRGSVPLTLDNVEIESVCYLSLDMNCAEPEVEAARYFWPKLVESGVVVLDDYGFRGYEPTKKIFDAFAEEVGVHILSLPTGQGLFLKA